jgi:tRNA nucleotidyltransferase (CCA-adding enzyme)
VVYTWQQFLDHIQEMKIFDAASWKRLVDGRQLTNALDAEPGRWVMAALQVCMAWQFRNPKETDPRGAIEEVKSKSEELRIPFKATASKAEKWVDVNGNNVAL